MSDLVSDKTVNLRATLTQHGEMYHGLGAPIPPPKKPAGKCPKCNSLMTRVPKPMST